MVLKCSEAAAVAASDCQSRCSDFVLAKGTIKDRLKTKHHERTLKTRAWTAQAATWRQITESKMLWTTTVQQTVQTALSCP